MIIGEQEILEKASLRLTTEKIDGVVFLEDLLVELPGGEVKKFFQEVSEELKALSCLLDIDQRIVAGELTDKDVPKELANLAKRLMAFLEKFEEGLVPGIVPLKIREEFQRIIKGSLVEVLSFLSVLGLAHLVSGLEKFFGK